MIRGGMKMCLAMLGSLTVMQAWAQTATPVAQPWMAPLAAARKTNPAPGGDQAVAEGKTMFTQNCLPCHGSKGDGDGPAAAFLTKHPGILSDSKMWLQTDGALFWKITHGNSPMPPFGGQLTGAQRWQLVEYIRTLAPKPAGYVDAYASLPPVVNRARQSANAPLSPAAHHGESKTAAAEAPASAVELQKLALEVANLKEAQARSIAVLQDSLRVQSEAAADLQEENARAMEEMRQEAAETRTMAKDAYPGTTKMMLVGYGTAGLNGRRVGDAAVRPLNYATFNSLMLWKLSDRLLFEGELEFEMEGTSTSTNLEVAQTTWLLNDYLAFGAGKFLNPMNFFVERQHMNWVNKLPDKPLAVYDGLMPESQVGMQIRGVAPLGKTKLEYAAFLANASALITNDSEAFGSLEYNDFDNANGNIAYGGHVGFIPHPEVEIGYGMMASQVGPAGTHLMAYMQSVDVNCVEDRDALKGMLSVRGQWAWSMIDAMTYDADGARGFGPVDFDNRRQGGYAQVSYRPSRIKHGFFKQLEPEIRYDAYLQKRTPVGYDEVRLSAGLDYWLKSNVVLKGAYEIDHQNGSGVNGDAFIFQFVSGF